MKKITCVFFSLCLLLAGCSKDEPEEPDPVPDYSTEREEAIFKETGCKPLDVGSIKEFELFTDSIHNLKYLTGSKYVNGLQSFWVSQYNGSGDCIWEVIQPDKNYSSRAYEPHVLSNGSLVVGKVLMETLNVKEVAPVIISQKGEPVYVQIYSGFYYNKVAVCDRFFICSCEGNDIFLVESAKEYAVQIDNSGKVMRQGAKMYIPQGKTVWPTDTTYINMTPSFIERASLLNGRVWNCPVELPEHAKCMMELALNDDKVKATYYLSRSGESQKDTVSYTLSYYTGKTPVKVTGIAISPEKLGLQIGETYQLKAVFSPEDASITCVEWASSNPQIATIDEDGKVKALQKGTCTLSATSRDGGFKAECVLKVTGPEEVNGIHFENAPEELLIGQSYSLKAIVTPATAVNKKIKWSSSDNRLASVNQQGVVIALQKGTVQITAETEEGGFKATCRIKTVGIEKYIEIDFTARIESFLNGYVTGSIFSRLINRSPEAIKVTKLTIVDSATGLIVGMADPSILGELLPGYYLSVGGNFYHVYYPLFVWEYEYKGRTYQAKEAFLHGNLSNAPSPQALQNILRNLPQGVPPASQLIPLQRQRQ